MVGPQVAEDLAQVVFAKAAKGLPSFRSGAEASTWLYRIAVNVATDWLRSRASHEGKVTDQLPDFVFDEASEPSSSFELQDGQRSPEHELIRGDMRACIRNVIARLPAAHQTVLVLGELDGLTDEEVAQVLGISRTNAKVRLHRARAKLKAALEGRCEFYRNEDNELSCEPKPQDGCAAGQRQGYSDLKQ
jgi:RNA polymerase sigma-70 factor, ECF subfamily